MPYSDSSSVPKYPPSLWEEPADESRFGDTADGESHSGGARRDVVLAHGVEHFVEGADNDSLQAKIHLLGIPEQAFLVLDPLEIADGDAAGVGENIGQDSDAAARENFVRVRRGGTIRGFRNDTRLHDLGVIQRDDVFKRSGNQDVAFHGEQVVVGDARSAGHADDGAGALLVAYGLDGIDAARVGDAAAAIAERNDFCFLFGEEASGGRAGVAEALNGDGSAAQGNFLDLAGFFNDEEQAASGGLRASQRTADGDGFAGDDAGDGVALHHGIGVHDPGHGLRVGVNIGSGDVLVRADDGKNFAGEAAGHALEFALGHALGIANDAALGSAEGNIDDGGFPGHPGC